MASARCPIMDSLGKLLSFRRARVASCASTLLINIPRAFITRRSHAKHEPIVYWNTSYDYESQTNS